MQSKFGLKLHTRIAGTHGACSKVFASAATMGAAVAV